MSKRQSAFDRGITFAIIPLQSFHGLGLSLLDKTIAGLIAGRSSQGKPCLLSNADFAELLEKRGTASVRRSLKKMQGNIVERKGSHFKRELWINRLIVTLDDKTNRRTMTLDDKTNRVKNEHTLCSKMSTMKTENKRRGKKAQTVQAVCLNCKKLCDPVMWFDGGGAFCSGECFVGYKP